MTDTALPEPPPKRSKLPLILGLVLALVLGGVGFYATRAGLVPGLGSAEPEGEKAPSPLPDIAFVAFDPLVVSLGPGARSRHLRFTAQLEVTRKTEAEVRLLIPRIVDVLNSYLRAVSPADLENPAALVRLRAQMLRRVQIVTGEGRVRDILVTEFVLN
ncbi:flagellar basal body-associated FliL family protein [Ruixingdingia sedimenti]|uniref:Flagellar protein FliL n=1 Tax=Ruixingdingia sedimenti TaxID=3073604 RepID=A0ABU1F7B9_9RHOB|nr:flagellar basal body-associated FliL family protein [Xinfangfangia sp. LG-4]MDR5652724.1 flagellar basal body-associated FliL family protein [Xinfangfangia sp. LG-4]